MVDEPIMYLLQNLKTLANDSNTGETLEYQVIADAHIVGEWKNGPYYFTIWELGNPKRQGEERLLCLRVTEAAFPRNTTLDEKPSKAGYYHGGGVASEIVALASLFLRRRLTLGPIVRLGDLPRMMGDGGGNFLDPELVSDSCNLQDLTEWMDMVLRLPPKYHQRFILAVKLYQQALELIESKPDIAYLNLVSSIEVLSSDFPITKSLRSVNGKLEKLLAKVEDESLREQIEKTVLSREKFICQRFVAFVEAHIDESFWQSDETVNRVRRADLGKYLKRIYRQRSNTLHAGQPFPPWVFHSSGSREIDEHVLAYSVGDRRWAPTEFIPYPHFFERLVNHVLKTYLKRKTQARS